MAIGAGSIHLDNVVPLLGCFKNLRTFAFTLSKHYRWPSPQIQSVLEALQQTSPGLESLSLLVLDGAATEERDPMRLDTSRPLGPTTQCIRYLSVFQRLKRVELHLDWLLPDGFPLDFSYLTNEEAFTWSHARIPLIEMLPSTIERIGLQNNFHGGFDDDYVQVRSPAYVMHQKRFVAMMRLALQGFEKHTSVLPALKMVQLQNAPDDFVDEFCEMIGPGVVIFTIGEMQTRTGVLEGEIEASNEAETG